MNISKNQGNIYAIGKLWGVIMESVQIVAKCLGVVGIFILPLLVIALANYLMLYF